MRNSQFARAIDFLWTIVIDERMIHRQLILNRIYILAHIIEIDEK